MCVDESRVRRTAPARGKASGKVAGTKNHASARSDDGAPRPRMREDPQLDADLAAVEEVEARHGDVRCQCDRIQYDADALVTEEAFEHESAPQASYTKRAPPPNVQQIVR